MSENFEPTLEKRSNATADHADDPLKEYRSGASSSGRNGESETLLTPDRREHSEPVKSMLNDFGIFEPKSDSSRNPSTSKAGEALAGPETTR